MDKKSKIYVAGHLGLVGQSLVKALTEKGYKNLILRNRDELDLIKQEATEKFFESERPEYVFLAAAKVGGILANSTYKAEFIYDNIMIAANIIKAAYEYGVKKLLNLGSSCIYPKLAVQPMKEEALLSGYLEPTNEPYAVAKIAAIKLCRYFNEQYATNFISVMPTNLYGPNDNFNLETSHVIPSMIRKFRLAKFLSEGNWNAVKKDVSRFPLGYGLDNKVELDNQGSIYRALESLGIKGEEVILWGSGEVYREFLYSDDLASACLFLMEKLDFRQIGEFINIGSGTEIKVKELAQLIAKVVGFKGRIAWDISKPDGHPRKLLDVEKLKSLGWESKISLTQGIELTCEWLDK